jgi:hypothetical protein
MNNSLDVLQALAALLLAVSLAAERLVALMKTIFPKLAVEKTTPTQEVDLKADRGRRLTIQVVAFAASYMTLALVFDTWHPDAKIHVGPHDYQLALLAFLASGGSAFWGGVVGYVKEAKDVKTTIKATVRAQYVASAGGPAAMPSGVGLQP